ncbi:MAG TPA: GAF domain-containing sensor histidine kinase [Kineosporiaceae bacterium]|nr:GAF domain-containing sensor histidine kinase [Kineosporiaceae bacterium]
MSLHALKVVGVVLPITFVLVLEVIRFVVVEGDMTTENNPGEMGGHVVLALFTIICVVAFASAMFFFIDRTQAQVLRQNRQLSAVNAVSTAVRDDLSVERIIDRALGSVLMSSGALSASISIPGQDRVRVEVHPDDAHPAGAGAVLDVALTAGTTSVGMLRLQLPAGQDRPDGLTADTLQTIAQQMAYAIQRAQLVADLQRGQEEGHAMYEVLLRISGQRSLAATLRTVVRDARDLLHGHDAVLSLDETASRILLVDGLSENGPGGRPLRVEGLLCVTPEGLVPGGRSECACGSDDLTAVLGVPIGSPGSASGELSVYRSSGKPFSERDRRFLVTLAELITIALAGARMRENERQGAIVAERERIARELHDSLAQVLGVTHLRLQALRGKADVRASRPVDTELGELAGICHEAYRDVREAILGLGQSARPDRNLLDSLEAYLQAFSRQCGIETSLEGPTDEDLVLAPRCEVQVIRIIQEALTNVRKHSGAQRATVRVEQTDRAVRFAVQDDGAGFDLAAVPVGRDGFGFGLSSMQERVRLIGGSLAIDTGPGRGTRLQIDVPAALVQSSPPPQVVALRGAGTRGA